MPDLNGVGTGREVGEFDGVVSVSFKEDH
jgi:hypothetical protein